VIVCTDGAAGHHFRTREETARLRLTEQLKSVQLGGYEFALLSLPNGQVAREIGLGERTQGLQAGLNPAVAADRLRFRDLLQGEAAGVEIDLAKGLKLETTAGTGSASASPGVGGNTNGSGVGLLYQFEY